MTKRIFTLSIVLMLVVGWSIDSVLPFNFNSYTRTYYGTSVEAKPDDTLLTDPLTGWLYVETDTGVTFIYNGSTWVVQTIYAVGDSTGASLAAPGSTEAIYVRGYNIAGFLFEITLKNTSVTIGLQGKVGTSGWTNVDTDPTVYTANGNEGIITTNLANLDSLRLNFSAEAGGSNAIITNIVSTRGKQ